MSAVTASREERADFNLRPYILAAKEKSGTKISYVLDVTDPAGKRVNRFAGEEVVAGNASQDPWTCDNSRGRPVDHDEGDGRVRGLASQRAIGRSRNQRHAASRRRRERPKGRPGF